MDQLTLGIGTRLQHTQYGPGVIVGIRYATYLISFINHGVKEVDKTDGHLDEIHTRECNGRYRNTFRCREVLIKDTPSLGRHHRERAAWRQMAGVAS